jgi:hypothetical protein
MNENLETALRASLRREAAPADFAAKILAKASATLPQPALSVVKLPEVKPKPKPWLRRPFTLALAAALAAVAIVPAVVLDYERRETARGLKAKRDLLTALAITKDQLQQAREKVRRTTRIIQW